jgi:hypothetical protein
MWLLIPEQNEGAKEDQHSAFDIRMVGQGKSECK